MVKVRALKLGFDGVSRRRPGDIFEIPDSMPLGRWMELVVEEKPEPVAEKPKRKRRTKAEMQMIRGERNGD